MTVTIKGLEEPNQTPPTPPLRFERVLTVEEIEAALAAVLTAIEANEDRERVG